MIDKKKRAFTFSFGGRKKPAQVAKADSAGNVLDAKIPQTLAMKKAG